MKILTEKYELAKTRLPHSGQFIIGHQSEKEIVVYQAYKPSIAKFCIEHQVLGGEGFSFGRMSWIKPNFLWMMYRCGWAQKENQERVLAIWINKEVMEDILNDSVFSSFDPMYHSSKDKWLMELSSKEVRLQWDPDHDPHGNKLVRKAIQLGLKGEILKNFGEKWINNIEDITDFVREQRVFVQSDQLDKLSVPIESIWEPNLSLKQKIGITN